MVAAWLFEKLPMLVSQSWCCELRDSLVPGTVTYVNGMLVHIDRDLESAFLFEVVDHDTSLVRHVALVVYFAELAGWEMHPHPPEPFFERATGEFELVRWFVDWYEQHRLAAAGHAAADDDDDDDDEPGVAGR